MQSRHVAVLAVAIVLGLSFMPQMVNPSQPDAARGWAGPHPSQLVSYNVDVRGGLSNEFGKPVYLTALVKGNGFVVTNVTVTAADGVNFRPGSFRLKENTNKTLVQWAVTGGAATQPQSFGSIHVSAGVPLSLQCADNHSGSKLPYSVTVTGYTW